MPDGERSGILLSLLVPAYEYREGIARILKILGPALAKHRDVELVISDDSRSSHVSDAIAESAFSEFVTCQRNQPPLGACANWNALIDGARGEYCLLLHHDECLTSAGALEEILDTIRPRPPERSCDAMVLDCVLVSPTGGSRCHSPRWLRSLVCRHVPNYLWRRNVIGPVSALVVRRSMFPRFDARLRWMIDVTAYVELFRSAATVVTPAIAVASFSRVAGSITASLGNTTAVEREELAYLSQEKFPSSRTLRLLSTRPVGFQLFLGMEALVWGSIAVALRLWGWLCPPLRRAWVEEMFDVP